MLHTVLLVVHVATGSAALLLGPLAMRHDVRGFLTGQRATGRVNWLYRGVVLLVCLSAVTLVVGYRPELWWLVPVSALTYGLAVLARVSAIRRFRGWTHGYVHGVGGSYIALVTALIVVTLTVDGPVTGPAQLVPWLAPTVLGTVLIEVWRRHLERVLPPTTGCPPGTVLSVRPAPARPTVNRSAIPPGRSAVMPTDHPVVRVGDRERDHVATVLGEHLAAGRLTMSEFDDRLDATFAARIGAELDQLLADLPPLAPTPTPTRVPNTSTSAAPVWTPWALTSLLCLLIWAATSLAQSRPLEFWPVWVIGPWGLVLGARLVRPHSGISR